MNKAFRERVFEIVTQIPIGQTFTYRQVAERAGSPKAYRAVGNILKTNFNPSIPCHRVVRSDGAPGGYNRGGASAKGEILQKEGADLTSLNSVY